MSTVLTVLKYDFRRFVRDWFMFGASVLILCLYAAVSLFVPSDIAPTWQIAVTKSSRAALTDMLERDIEENADFELHTFASEEEMRKVFESGDHDFFLGLHLQGDPKAALARGERPKARVYVDESAPPEVQETARAIGAMMAMASAMPPGERREEPERIGPVVEQTNFHDRSRSLMAIMILLMEMLALASLMSREISSGVVHAILTTTVSLPRYFAAKMVFGVVLAFAQAGLVAALTGALSPNPAVITAQLLLGSVMFTALGIVAGTRGKHLMEVIMWGMLFILPCMVPAVTAMLPGTPPLIVQALPTYPVIHGVLTAGHSTPLVPAVVYLAWSFGWAAALAGLSYATLRRRVE